MFVLFVGTSFTQKNVISFNVAGLAFDSYSLEYERILTKKTSAVIELGYFYKSFDFTIVAPELSIMSIEGRCKISIAKKEKEMPRGGYIAPLLAYGNMNGTANLFGFNIIEKFSFFQIGGIVGKQWILGSTSKGFAINAYIGLTYMNIFYKNSSINIPINSVLPTLILPKLGINLGYAF